MLLSELFDHTDIIQRLRSYALDMILPLAAQGVPYVNTSAITDKLAATRPGLEIDQALLFQILDPNKVKMITKIEGDRVYFEIPEIVDRAVSDDEEQREANKVSAMATAQAKKEVKEN